jgi:hypothetical protein
MRTNLISNSNSSQKMDRNLLVNVVASLILTVAQPTLAQMQQKTFATPEQATQALYDAVRAEDDQAITAILGAAELSTSGNEVQDTLERERFAKKYEEMNRLVREPDGSVVLYVGAENWPFPIPLEATSGHWQFDSDSGSQEILARVIGENESAAIKVCQTIGKANRIDKDEDNEPVIEFAQKLARSNTDANGALFDGYYFRTLKNNAHDIVVVAYPARYRSSGMMTFMVRNGAVYEKDLGPQTDTVAQKIQGKPNGKWSLVQ